jgi:hypothetical protein
MTNDTEELAKSSPAAAAPVSLSTSPASMTWQHSESRFWMTF